MNLARALAPKLSVRGVSFGSIMGLAQECSELAEVRDSSKRELTEAVKPLGFVLKRPVVHDQETNNVKESRIHFYSEYGLTLNCSQNKVVYFYWTSFSDNNFKRQVWSKKEHVQSLETAMSMLDSIYLQQFQKKESREFSLCELGCPITSFSISSLKFAIVWLITLKTKMSNL